MRKILALMFALLMVFAFAACSKAPDNTETEAPSSQQNSTETAPAETTEAPTSGTTEAEKPDESKLAIEEDPEYVVFNVSYDFELEEDAWLGVIPTGTLYENEVDADEYDIIYTYCDNFNFDGATSYRFAFEKDYFFSIEDGVYDMVLCSTDSGETGKVLLQIGLEKNGESITLDYENSK